MMDPNEILDQALTMALRGGADQVEGVYATQAQTSVQVRNGQLAKTNRADAATLSIRLILNQQMATVTTSDLNQEPLARLIENGLTIARQAPKEPSNHLIAAEQVTSEVAEDLDLFDPDLVSAESLLNAALDIEAATLGVEHVTQSGGAGATATEASMILKSTNGLSAKTDRTVFSRWSSAIAERDRAKFAAHYFCLRTHHDDLESTSLIGAEAGQRAVAKLGATRVNTGAFPVVFSQDRASDLINLLGYAISGPTVAQGVSFLRDKLGQPVFPAGVHIVDDPGIKRGLGSRSFDGEGVVSRALTVFEDGVLIHWLTNAASAQQLNAPLTGHGLPLGRGVSPSNLHLVASDISVDALLSDISYGLFVTDFLGQGANLITGDYSQAVSGFVIENGQLGQPVKEATIAGHLLDMFKQVTPANDLVLRQQVNAPTIRIDGMQVAG